MFCYVPGGSTRPIFGYWWAAQGLKPLPCLGQKIPKINTLFTAIPSILLPCLGQWSKSTPSCFKVVYWQLEKNKHCFCLIGVQTKLIQQIKSIVQAIPFRENHTKLYSLLVFSTGRWRPYTVRSLTLSNGTPMYSPCGGGGSPGTWCLFYSKLSKVCCVKPKSPVSFSWLVTARET